ncbi:VTT domain-containing protein [Streptomyces sp. NPDC023723]|uniref:DedA family protein n=1 Tax=Streptomyces sp. NPDC023723 TaxID=3154323 RepID=UPI0033D23CC3
MNTAMTAAMNVLDAQSLIAAFGLAGILIILFVETGLLFGFFLPGDSLLFLAGVGASGAAAEVFDQPGFHLSLTALLIGAPLCATAGAQLGHLLGARIGPKLFARPESRLFKQEYVHKAEAYFARYGAGKAVVLARFLPVVRTFLNPVAGVLGMRAGQFLLWNLLGGCLWTVGLILLGYQLGDSLKGSIDSYLLPAVVLIIVLSLVPVLIEAIRSRRAAESQ